MKLYKEEHDQILSLKMKDEREIMRNHRSQWAPNILGAAYRDTHLRWFWHCDSVQEEELQVHQLFCSDHVSYAP